MFTGTVKWFDRAKGYGFIVPDEGQALPTRGKDVIVHSLGLEKAGIDYLQAGDRISFSVEQNKERTRYRATDLRLMEG